MESRAIQVQLQLQQFRVLSAFVAFAVLHLRQCLLHATLLSCWLISAFFCFFCFGEPKFDNNLAFIAFSWLRESWRRHSLLAFVTREHGHRERQADRQKKKETGTELFASVALPLAVSQIYCQLPAAPASQEPRPQPPS